MYIQTFFQENDIENAKIVQPKNKFDIFDEDNWSCQSDSSLDNSKYDVCSN